MIDFLHLLCYSPYQQTLPYFIVSSLNVAFAVIVFFLFFNIVPYKNSISSTKFRRSLCGVSGQAANTAEKAFFLPASSAGTAVHTSALRSGTQLQNTVGSSGSVTTNLRVSTNAKHRTWMRKPSKCGSWLPSTLSLTARTASSRTAA